MLNCPVVDDGAEVAAIGLEQRGGGLHLDGFGDGAELHLDIQAGVCIDLDNDAGCFGTAEAVFLGGDVIAASSQG